MKIYCASDFHIGYEHANYTKIEEFFDLVNDKADKLILCGDILDLWRCPIDRMKREKPMKSAFEALLATARDVPTVYIWGNHDYNVSNEVREIRESIKVSDDFVSKNIYYCHGWRFDLQQRLGYLLYGWLVKRFPYLYQLFFKKPFEIEENEKEYTELSRMIHDEARRHIKPKKVKYLIMGHTHDPIEEAKLYDCGDMVDSLSYIVIENGVPKLKKLSRK